ncbi:protein SYS1 homolog [Gordionus sp. m RMFG-2023]|uniref:protein SYS1 homolog n=1 Tax=Gordionus sp. m RMFG-2023 TaxID=3053472 RepID=UPI0031FBF435
MVNKFRPYVWDPIYIMLQIIILQSIYYAMLGILLSIFLRFELKAPSIHYIFIHENINFSDTLGKVISCLFILNSLISSLAIWFLVKRTKLCLDFSTTIIIIHIIISYLLKKQIPSTFAWWLINVTCLTLCTVVAEYLCMKTELKQIPTEYSCLNNI